MPRPRRTSGDTELASLFDKFEGRLVTPAGAAALLGLSRKTIHALCVRGDLRAFRNQPPQMGQAPQPRWVYIPLADVKKHAEKTDRVSPTIQTWKRWLKEPT